MGGQRSASTLGHEVDGASRTSMCLTHWELKNLSGSIDKNEFLIFNAKGLDFLQGSRFDVAGVPVHRFFVSGSTVRAECRLYSVLWSIVLVEPDLVPLPLLCEAVARGGATVLRPAEIDAVRERATWACRPLQFTINELAQWTAGSPNCRRLGSTATTLAKEILDIQEQLGRELLDWMDEVHPDWIDETAEDTWRIIGGW